MHQAERIVHELSAMWNSKDVDRIEDLFASDAVHEDMTSGVNLQGASAIRDLFAGTWQAIPDVRTEVGRVICQDRSSDRLARSRPTADSPLPGGCGGVRVAMAEFGWLWRSSGGWG